jgi:hypothetical protein
MHPESRCYEKIREHQHRSFKPIAAAILQLDHSNKGNFSEYLATSHPAMVFVPHNVLILTV